MVLPGAVRWAVVSVLAAGAFAGGVWLSTTRAETTTTVLGPRYGVSLELPSGWIGRIYDGGRGTPPSYAVLQATSVSSAGQNVLDSDDDTATQMAQDMAAEDILILLWESRGGGEENYQPVAVSPRITPDDFTPIEGFASTHAVGRIFFTSRGRFFDLMVEFGTTSPDAAQLARANDVLRTLRIESQRT